MVTDMPRLRLRRSELVVLVAASVFVAAMAIVWCSSGGAGIDKPHVPSDEYAMGEWVDLNNQVALDELRKKDTDSDMAEGDYRPFGEWNGTLRLRVDKVEVYDSPSAAGLTESDLLLPSYLPTWEQDGHSLCLLTYTIENVDASPIPGSTKSGREGFCNSFLASLEGIEAFDQIYFDGMIEDCSLEDGDGNIFRLDPGEAKVFHSGFVVAGEGTPSALQIGDPNCGMKVMLECEDKRNR